MKTVEIISLDKKTEYLDDATPIFYIEPPTPSMPISVSDDCRTMSVKYETYRAEIHRITEKGKYRNIVLDRDAQELVDIFVYTKARDLNEEHADAVHHLHMEIIRLKRPWYVRLASFLRG